MSAKSGETFAEAKREAVLGAAVRSSNKRMQVQMVPNPNASFVTVYPVVI